MTVLFMIFQILVNLLFTEIQPLQNFVLHRLELVPMDTETVRNYLYAAFDQNGDKVLSHTHFNAHDYREFLLSLQNQYPSAFENLAFKLQDFKIENPNFWVNAKTLATRILEIANTNKESLSHTETLAYWYDTGKTWPVLIYGALGAIFVGAGVALSWKAGGSTGGTDIVAYYFLSKTKKSVGHILSIVAIFTAIIFLVIYKFVKPNPDGVIIGVREISTFSYIVVSNLVVNKLYPKYKKIKMTIISSEPQKIIAYFNLINYWHSYRIVRFKSGYTGKYGFKIETVILLMEAKNLSDDLKLIDQNVWISETKVDRVTGKFNTTYVE
ncbi:YitT family protein [Mycoplasmopsis gallopavonis]|nr:YitT family protein [Mycoplasmopsis gallopavonis]